MFREEANFWSSVSDGITILFSKSSIFFSDMSLLLDSYFFEILPISRWNVRSDENAFSLEEKSRAYS